MQPVSKQVREFIRATDLLLQDVNANCEFNDFEKVLLASYATRLTAAATILQSKSLQREAVDLRRSRL